MATTEPLLGHVTNAADQHDLRGNMFPVDREIGPVECEVIGDLPEALRGRFVRNGPNQMFEPIGKHHIFDGDGMLHGIDFDGRPRHLPQPLDPHAAASRPRSRSVVRLPRAERCHELPRQVAHG